MNFSIVVPTFTGQEHIAECLKSIRTAAGRCNKVKYEIIIIIDGPNYELRQIIEEQKDEFIDGDVNIRIEQFYENKGRFEARLTGAKMAKADQLLFIDDRVTLDINYFKALHNIKERLAIPNVIENEKIVTPISLTLRLIRGKIYGKKWGNEFKDYYINKSNFNQSPKGTTSLWVGKDDFISACTAVAVDGSSRYINEDTKILNQLIFNTSDILRTDKLRIYYNPRVNHVEEIKHIYERAPRFVNYYLSPQKPYFIVLVSFYVFVCIFLGLLIFGYNKAIFTILLSLILLNITSAVFLAGFSRKLLNVLVGVFIIELAFGIGLVKGLYVKIFTKRPS